MSGHGANPVFFNEKNKDWTSRTLAFIWPPTSDNILIPTQTHTHTCTQSSPQSGRHVCINPSLI